MSLGSYSLGSSPLGGGAGIPPSISGDANLASVLATFGPPHRALIPPASPIPQQGYMIMLWLYGGISPAMISFQTGMQSFTVPAGGNLWTVPPGGNYWTIPI